MKNNTGKNAAAQDLRKLPTDRDDLVKDLNAGKLRFYNMENDSKFVHLGINPFDIVIVYLTNQINENQLCVWDFTDGYDIAFGYDNFGDTTLHNDKDWFKRYSKRENARCEGIVVGVIKSFNAENPQNLFLPKSEEIAAVCDKCKREMTETPEFIKSQGWELKENETVCLSCDLFGGAE